jgi:hypothetical protein
VRADLFPDEGDFTPRPAWQVIEAARRQMLTGELTLATTPATHVYLRDGQVYFAERSTDGGLGVRLLVEGVITRQQMGKGALLVSGVEHLGRMFQRDTTIDRLSVELCVELMTDDVLSAVADDVVTHYTMNMYKRHPSGIDRWLPNRVEVITHIVDAPQLADPEATVSPAPATRKKAEPAAPTAKPVAASAVPDAVPVEWVEVPVAPVTIEAAMTQPVPITVADAEFEAAMAVEPAAADAPAPAPAVEDTEATEGGLQLAQSAMDAIMSTAIADEVADAVKRALAAIDAAALPTPNLSPSDFTAHADA